MSGEKPREIAVQILGGRDNNSDFTEDLLERALSNASLPDSDRRLCMELVYGVVRWQAALDWLIAKKTDNRQQKPSLQNLLRLGLYQIFWLERVPDYAAVNVTVELAKRLGFGPQAGFINAVLRSYLRDAAPTRLSLEQLKNTHPARGFSHPEWLVQRWETKWGRSRTAKLLSWNNTPPKTFARVNTLKIEAEKLLPFWREENVEYDFVQRDWLEENLFFELKSHPPLGRLKSFKDGLFYIQDPSTALAVKELSPKPGERVLDLCAAPGGKLTYIAQLMKDQGHLVAYDSNPTRTRLITENCARLGVTCVETVSPESVQEIASPDQLASTEPYDRVLLDAPCSNTGVMGRRVDLRWRVTPEEIQRLKQSQLQLLRRAAALVKPGGVLVYSTCSLEPEENENVVKVVLAENPWLRLERQRQLTPFEDKADGAYVARICRAEVGQRRNDVP